MEAQFLFLFCSYSNLPSCAVRLTGRKQFFQRCPSFFVIHVGKHRYFLCLFKRVIITLHVRDFVYADIKERFAKDFYIKGIFFEVTMQGTVGTHGWGGGGGV
jgi:hypothetical protein